MNRTARTSSLAGIDEMASDWIVRRESGLSGAEEKAFADWQLADIRHAEAVARHDQAWSLLDRPRAGGRAGEMARALSSRARRRRRGRIGAAMAAAVAVLVFAAVRPTRRPVADLSSAANAVVLAPQKQTLPDGSVVELKAGAEITVDYTGRFRRVRLQNGEALFQVAKDSERAFVVAAGGVEVRAVGTAFVVQLGGAQVDVIVTEGKVAVANAPASGEDAAASLIRPASPVFSTMVEAGTRLTVDTVANLALPQAVAISPAEIAARLAWRAPRLEFSDVPLADAVVLLNRHSKLRLVVDDPTLAGIRVNGLFRADNTETLVRLLEASFGVKADREGDTIVLRRISAAPKSD